MANFQLLLLVRYTSLLLLACLICAADDEDRKVYIVYMGSLPREQEYAPNSHHLSLLRNVVGQRFSPNLIVRSYNRSFNGFAAKLTRREAEELSGMQNVVSVFPDRKYELLTTRSWDFLGLNVTTSRNQKSESDVIIGFLDTGIWPELQSFSDEGFGPPPEKWKGACKGGSNFTCNNKVIGARCYGSIDSARDGVGHGSHTASTAAGVAVENTAFYGLAQGTARGGAPLARIAVYKVCDTGCDSASILAAFDDAIADGVDILSISIGTKTPDPIDQDAVGIGAFHAIAKGILTCQSAGNSGSSGPGSIGSTAPWIISVAASSMDRRIIDKAILGNGKTLIGRSVNSFSLKGSKFPLVKCPDDARSRDSLEGGSVGGNITVCNGLYWVSDAVSRDTVGSIYKVVQESPDVSDIVPFPAVALLEDDYNEVLSYLNSSKSPVGTILKSEAIKDPSAPIVASFSSRGPNSMLREIMKPDVSAPGIDVLAGYSPVAPISDLGDDRHVKYSILSGTSMACPHVSGIAAYIKSFHPDWSPSAIHSAIMTTASPMDATANPDGEFAYGSGQVSPINATQPGLVYEAFKEDYIKLLCRAGLDEKKLRVITGDNSSSCPKGNDTDSVLDFNYPSLTAKVTADKSFTLRFQRTVTNVGQANSTYKVQVSPTRKFDVKVEPEALSFKSLKEKRSFNVTLSGKAFASNSFESASLVWSDGVYNVRTPIVVHTIDTDESSSLH